MVSPINSGKTRDCPALQRSIPVQQCVRERVLHLDCPTDCPSNPFNPDAPQVFDAVLSRGLENGTRWLEKMVGREECADRFMALEERFRPELDIPVISYELNYGLVTKAMSGKSYRKVKRGLEGEKGLGLRPEARLVLERLSQSKAMMLIVDEVNVALPYYRVRDAFNSERFFFYVDFGEKSPLEEGEVLFGRFIEYKGYLYVVPGIFIGMSDYAAQVVAATAVFRSESSSEQIMDDWMNENVPEIWKLCCLVQDELGVEDFDDEDEEGGAASEDPYAPEFDACDSRFPHGDSYGTVVQRLRGHPMFVEIENPQGLGEAARSGFNVFVENRKSGDDTVVPFSDDIFAEEEDDDEEYEFDDLFDTRGPIRAGTVYVSDTEIEVTAPSLTELGLLVALVKEIVPRSKS